MKKFIQLLTIVSVALVFGALASFAQSNTLVKGDIPFDFSVGNKTLHKGSYELTVVKNSSASAVVRIVDSNGNRVETVLGSVKAGKNSAKAQLTFARYGEKRFLTGISMPNYNLEISSQRIQGTASAVTTEAAVVDIAVGTN